MFCPICGSENPDGQAFCTTCGSQLAPVAGPSAAPSNPQQSSATQSAPSGPVTAANPASPVGTATLSAQPAQVAASVPAQGQPYAAPQSAAASQQYAAQQSYAASQANATQQYATQQPNAAVQPQALAGSGSGLAGFFGRIASAKVPYGVLALVGACLIIIIALVTRILNNSVFNANNFLYANFFEYFFTSISVSNVLFWIGVLLAGVGALAKNKILIGVGAALGALSAIVALFMTLTTLGMTSNPLYMATIILGDVLEAGAFVFLALFAFGAVKPEKATGILLLPAVLMLVNAVISLIGRLGVYAVFGLVANLAAAMLVLACTVVIANMAKEVGPIVEQ